jgi:hypothetical protein
MAATAGIIAAADQTYSTVRASSIVRDTGIYLGEQLPRFSARPVHYQISVGGERFATDPGEFAIKSAIAATAASQNDGAFLLLSQSDNEFIQAAVAKGGWILEFRVVELERPGSSPVVFECNRPVGRNVIFKALKFYRTGDRAWTDVCNWTTKDDLA